MPKLLLYQITYRDGQRVDFNEWRDHSREKKWRFEWNSMLDIMSFDPEYNNLSYTDYMGIVSWKFVQKTGLSRGDIIAGINRHMQHSNIDVFTACKPIQHNGFKTFMDWSEEGHKGIKYLLERCLWNIGARYYNDPAHVVYANQFIATKKVYYDFMEHWAKPSLKLLEGELWPIVNKDAGYQAGLSRHELRRYTGLPYYNYLPFVMERLFMQYLANSPEVKVKSLI